MNQHERKAASVFAKEGLTPRTWSSEPGHHFDWHEHAQAKVLFCVAGRITFRTMGNEKRLSPGDRLDLPAYTPHAADVGPRGVTCWEAFRA